MFSLTNSLVWKFTIFTALFRYLFISIPAAYSHSLIEHSDSLWSSFYTAMIYVTISFFLTLIPNYYIHKFTIWLFFEKTKGLFWTTDNV